jgi:enediyne polyketide synthase
MPERSDPVFVSLACRFPDAPSPRDLWANVLDGRRAFRAVPRERLDLGEYAADLLGEPDSITPVKAGLITDWRFNRTRFRIPSGTYEATDAAHWLALETAAAAIEAAGGRDALDRSRTAVVVANTLTGEFSRAAALRLRLPFLARLLAEAAEDVRLRPEEMARLQQRFGDALRAALPEPQEESLAGGLANTIAGRIANFFDLKAGAFSVDGACASSLVAIADAANLLVTGQADAVVVGAVDLSLDPFELVGFSRLGALASGEMRVFDARSSGFWPGEGAGFAVLLRADTARRREMPALATLRGWGLSTDGAGGLTRPTVEGQLAALRSAQERAAIDPGDLGYVEAHGTGTAVGDPVEVRALGAFRGAARAALPIGSIKANIGHTKAAAGFAGLLKAIGALRAGIVPPHVGCETPHPVFAETEGRIMPALAAAPWPETAARLAGVSSFGFGGVNAHVVLEGPGDARREAVPPAGRRREEAEPFFFAAPTADALLPGIERLARRAATLSASEMVDAAAACAADLSEGACRVAVLARDGEELAHALGRAMEAIRTGETLRDPAGGVFAASAGRSPRLGFVFPGQGAPSRPDGGSWPAEVAGLAELLSEVPAEGRADPSGTQVAQPAIVAASVAALQRLAAHGIDAGIAVGHSLGEITALVWSGALEEREAVRLAARRGVLMARHGAPGGAMLRLDCSAGRAARMIAATPLVIACENAAEETVVSGPAPDIHALRARAEAEGVAATPLTVSHAFHSPMVEGAADPLGEALADVRLRPPRRAFVSSVLGAAVPPAADLAALLVRQVGAPVRFRQALDILQESCDLVIEVGPGGGLTRLVLERGLPGISVDACGVSSEAFARTLALAFSFGAAVDPGAFFAERRVRAIDLGAVPSFLANPCGRGPSASAPRAATARSPAASAADASHDQLPPAADALSAVVAAVARATALARGGVEPHHRMLDDLHLNSLSVARLVTAAAKSLGVAPPRAPTEFANASLAEIAAALEEMRDLGGPPIGQERVAGVRPWVRTYGMGWRQEVPPAQAGAGLQWREVGIGAAASGEEAGPWPNLALRLRGPCDAAAMQALFARCQAAWADPAVERLAICHTGAPVSAFARSLAAERRFALVRVIEHEEKTAQGALERELARDAQGFEEVRLDARGGRAVALFAPVVPRTGCAEPLGSGDVVLATGGARGIGAECALALGRSSGAALVFVGRSAAGDPAVQATLARAAAGGIRCTYVQADVCDAQALRRSLDRLDVGALGPVTALLHAAGCNEPRRFPDIGAELLARTLDPKVEGFRNAVAAAGPSLRRVVAFGSIIGRLGLEGEAHYALANALQARIAEELAAARPGLAALVIEWSVWGGTGMGEKLGTLERLEAMGVDALSIDDALAAFDALLGSGAVGSVVVTSRFGAPNRLPLAPQALPILRFLDRPVLHYPGVEIVVETELCLGRDPWLADHQIGGVAILPSVMALEAMAQVASTLAGCRALTGVSDVEFLRALDIPDGTEQAIRIAALAAADGSIETVLRAAEDGFASDRLRARFLAGEAATGDPVRQAEVAIPADSTGCEADSLYGTLFFNTGRFRRIGSFTHLSARAAAFRLSAPRGEESWFGPFEPAALLLGDPGARDAGLHGLQACVPHRRVLPIGVRRISFLPGGHPVGVVAWETEAGGDAFVFDIAFLDARGRVVETWEGARFAPIDAIDAERVLREALALTAAYVERVARSELGDETIRVALAHGGDRQRRREELLARLGLAGRVETRGDGRPIAIRGAPLNVSLSHENGVSLAVVAERPIGCDLVESDEAGGIRTGGGEHDAPGTAAAWALSESLRKTSLHAAHPAYPGRILAIRAPHPAPGHEAAFLVMAMALGEATRETSLFGSAADASPAVERAAGGGE